MVRTGAEPNPQRAFAPDAVEYDAPSGKYGKLLERVDWNRGLEPERFELTVGRKTYPCAICHNGAQLQAALDADIVRVIA